MITRMKYVGTQEGGDLTQDQCYIVLGFTAPYNSMRAVIIDDNGFPYATQTAIDNPENWQLESVTECGEQVFPIVPPGEGG